MGKVDILNKPDQELSSKLIAEVNAGILPASEALSILYPDIADEVRQQELLRQSESLGDPKADTANMEAQANLRGSVGGVQGILSIQAGVQAGTTSRESAFAMLREIYGFSDQVANEILGA